MAKNVRGAKRNAVRAISGFSPIYNILRLITYVHVHIYTKYAKINIFEKSIFGAFWLILGPVLEKGQIWSQRGKKYLLKINILFPINAQLGVILDREPIFVVKIAFNATFHI